MGDKIPQVTFATPENMATLWHNIAVILAFVMPFFILWLATEYGGYFISVIRQAFTIGKDRKDEYGEKADYNK